MPLNVLAAQDAPENTSVVTYGEDYFKKYSPLTLIDILERIPGVPAILGQGNGQRQQERGFGSSGDQILINGKRLSAKGNSIRDLLSRTPAGDVERVELIRGAADGLEVQSEGLVVNVIIKEDASTSSTFWKVGAFYMTGHKLLPDFEVSHKGKRDKLDYTFAAEALLRAGKFNRDEIFYDANDIQTGARDVDGDWSHKRIKLTTNLSYDFDDGEIFNINGLYNRFRNENDQHHVDRDVGGETLFWDSGDNFLEWEIAGDYSRNFGFLGNLKSRFVINREANDDNLTNRFNGSGDARYIYNKEIFDFNSSEEILRVSFTKNLSSSQSLEYGGEGAFNSFSQIFSSEERDTAGEPLELTSANNIIVKENRYEIFAHHNYTITPKMVLQSSLTTEFSKISSDTILADDIVTVNNSFTFFKPRLNFKYDLTDRNQLRLVGEKKVSQLEFFHYFTFFDQIAKELRFGNTDIKPVETWEFSGTYEHRFPNDSGSIETKIFYRNHKNFITRSDFSDYADFGGNPISAEQYFALPPDAALRGDTDFSSKFGNIDKANAYGLNVKGNFRLGFIGLKDAQLSLDYEFERRRFKDPFTLQTRNFSWTYDHKFNVDFRHDLPELGLSYGFEAEFGGDFSHSDINFDWQFEGRDTFEVFLEKKILGDIKARLEFEKNGEVNTRAVFYRYKDHRRFNEIKSYDEQLIDQPYRISLSIEGTF